jgi:hypothetical protein
VEKEVCQKLVHQVVLDMEGKVEEATSMEAGLMVERNMEAWDCHVNLAVVVGMYPLTNSLLVVV